MSGAFRIVDDKDVQLQQKKCPEVPFVIMTEKGLKYLIVEDSETNKYRIACLGSGSLFSQEFDTLEEYFNVYPGDIIMKSELVIKGEFYGN